MARRPAFTLVEVVLAAAVLVGLTAGVYQLHRSLNRHASQVAWTSEAQKELRTCLKRVFDELGKASYWSEVTPSRVVTLDEAGTAAASADQEREFQRAYWVENGAGATGSPVQLGFAPGSGGPQQLLSWLQCAPRRAGFDSAAENRPGSTARCALILDGDVLVFQRERTQDAAGVVVPITTRLVHGVEAVEVELRPKTEATGALDGTVIALAVTVHHPDRNAFPNARLRQEITCRVPVGYVGQP